MITKCTHDWSSYPLTAEVLLVLIDYWAKVIYDSVKKIKQSSVVYLFRLEKHCLEPGAGGGVMQQIYSNRLDTNTPLFCFHFYKSNQSFIIKHYESESIKCATVCGFICRFPYNLHYNLLLDLNWCQSTHHQWFIMTLLIKDHNRRPTPQYCFKKGQKTEISTAATQKLS